MGRRSTPPVMPVALAVAHAGVLAWAWAAGVLPPAPLAAVPVANLAAFTLHALDKRAAVRGRSRIPERTLHLCSLAGGWPGAWLAQGLLRHKTAKAAFRARQRGVILAHWILLLAALGAASPPLHS